LPEAHHFTLVKVDGGKNGKRHSSSLA